MPKTCYVIMPYGGQDEEKQRHYLSIFDTIIAPAARNAGYEPRRSDVHGDAGSIPAEIIRSLAGADVVIADLSEGNANVFYELGIRHALRKRGTVHIINKDHTIPFDVAQYRLVQYSTRSFSDIAPAVDAICKAIKQREEESAVSDNLVHDTLLNLPIDVSNLGSQDVQKQMAELQSQIATISDERDKLRREIETLSPNGVISPLDLDSLFAEADTARKFSGENVYYRLANIISGDTEEERDAFVKELRVILKSPYLSRVDFLRIANLCRKVGLEPYNRIVLEFAHAQYMEDLDILIALADAYQSSPSQAEQARGRKLIEDFLKVEHTPTGPRMKQTPVGNVYSAAMTLFNFYLVNGHFGWVVSFAESLEEHMGQSNISARNRARALHKLGRTREADDEFKRGISLDPGDDTVYKWYADYLDDNRQYAQAYEAYEHAIKCDPRDGTLYVMLANHIMLRGFSRDQTGAIIGPLETVQRQRAAQPLYVRALADAYRDMRQRVIGDLTSHGLRTLAQAITQGTEIDTSDWDFAPLEYVDQLVQASASTN